MAPIVQALTSSPHFEPSIAVTAQHRSMLDQVHELFRIVPDIDLDIHQPGQTLTGITSRALSGVQAVLAARRPDVVMVQGDTTTTFAAALAAFYERVPLVHVEAGLRTGDVTSPYPEEINRRLTTQLAALHLAPTRGSRDNLLAENVDEERIVVTGNTVIDALKWTVSQTSGFGDSGLEDLDTLEAPVLLVTAHRRESWGEPMRAIGRAIARIAETYRDLVIVIPVHRNPVVREALLPAIADRANIRVTEPLHYAGFAKLMERSTLILTDSGGVQEEGPSFGKPVLVMRDTTERPEAVAAGTARLVGTDEARIVESVTGLLRDRGAYAEMANAVNPYGDGAAARRTVDALAYYFGVGPKPPAFSPLPSAQT